jgi:hypothetical protein
LQTPGDNASAVSREESRATIATGSTSDHENESSPESIEQMRAGRDDLSMIISDSPLTVVNLFPPTSSAPDSPSGHETEDSYEESYSGIFPSNGCSIVPISGNAKEIESPAMSLISALTVSSPLVVGGLESSFEESPQLMDFRNIKQLESLEVDSNGLRTSEDEDEEVAAEIEVEKRAKAKEEADFKAWDECVHPDENTKLRDDSGDCNYARQSLEGLFMEQPDETKSLLSTELGFMDSFRPLEKWCGGNSSHYPGLIVRAEYSLAYLAILDQQRRGCGPKMQKTILHKLLREYSEATFGLGRNEDEKRDKDQILLENNFTLSMRALRRVKVKEFAASDMTEQREIIQRVKTITSNVQRLSGENMRRTHPTQKTLKETPGRLEELRASHLEKLQNRNEKCVSRSIAKGTVLVEMYVFLDDCLVFRRDWPA